MTTNIAEQLVQERLEESLTNSLNQLKAIGEHCHIVESEMHEFGIGYMVMTNILLANRLRGILAGMDMADEKYTESMRRIVKERPEKKPFTLADLKIGEKP